MTGPARTLIPVYQDVAIGVHFAANVVPITTWPLSRGIALIPPTPGYHKSRPRTPLPKSGFWSAQFVAHGKILRLRRIDRQEPAQVRSHAGEGAGAVRQGVFHTRT
jgi:hypothetical protein